nr:MAG TPA: hypothetical protein [Caudoviricetes sp.]
MIYLHISGFFLYLCVWKEPILRCFWLSKPHICTILC